MNDRPLGRPSLLLDSRRNRTLIQLIRAGTPRYQAGIVLGIGSSTFMSWMRDGMTSQRKLEEGLTLTEQEHRFLKFRERVEQAEAYFESRAVSAVLAIAERDKKPSVLLEVLRRHPATRERWNVPQKLEMTPLQSDEPPDVSDAELATTLARLHRIASERVSQNRRASANAAESASPRPRRRASSVKKEGDRS